MYGVREAVIEISWMEPLPIIFKDLKTGGGGERKTVAPLIIPNTVNILNLTVNQ